MNSTGSCAAAHPDRSKRSQRPTLGCADHGGGAAPDPDTVRQLRQFAVALARHLAHGWVDSEDLAHEALERWLRSAPYLTPIANPRAWIAVVLRRLLVDRLRRQRAAVEIPTDCAGLSVIELDAAPWWYELEVGAVRRELDHLPPALRETFELFTFRARSYQQIARELNIAKATVGTRISRARALLKRRLIARWAATGGGPGAASAHFV